MTCDHDRAALFSFHVGELDDRDEVEARLTTCGDCLREYLAIKRAMDAGEDVAPPSDLARERLRKAVGRAIGAPVPRRGWHRPAAAAFAMFAVLVSFATMNAMTSGDGAPPYALEHGGPR